MDVGERWRRWESRTDASLVAVFSTKPEFHIASGSARFFSSARCMPYCSPCGDLSRARPSVLVLVTLFFSAVGLGQMLLFKGQRPRRASVIVGACVFPCMFLGNCLRATRHRSGECLPHLHFLGVTHHEVHDHPFRLFSVSCV